MQSLIVLASLISELAGRVKISGHFSPEIRASLEKIIIYFETLVEMAINYVSFV